MPFNKDKSRKLQKIGFSLIVTLPTKMIEELNLEKQSEVRWKKKRNGWGLEKVE